MPTNENVYANYLMCILNAGFMKNSYFLNRFCVGDEKQNDEQARFVCLISVAFFLIRRGRQGIIRIKGPRIPY
jgi:hypothetical protein